MSVYEIEDDECYPYELVKRLANGEHKFSILSLESIEIDNDEEEQIVLDYIEAKRIFENTREAFGRLRRKKEQR